MTEQVLFEIIGLINNKDRLNSILKLTTIFKGDEVLKLQYQIIFPICEGGGGINGYTVKPNLHIIDLKISV